MNKGNVLVIVLVLVGLLFLVKFTLPKNNPVIPQDQIQNITSNKITLSVSSDKNGLITGKTSAFAEVFINDQETKADKNGDFSLKIDLDQGENNVIVTANDSDGNVAEQSLVVNNNE